jgi:hypothetical protein
MAIRVKLGEYAATEAESRFNRTWVFTAVLVVVAVFVVGRGSVAGLTSATSESDDSAAAQPRAEPSRVEQPAVEHAVFVEANWRSAESTAAAAVARRPVYRAPVLLEELVNPRVYTNLQGVAICQVGTARDGSLAQAVPAPYRSSETTKASSAQSSDE